MSTSAECLQARFAFMYGVREKCGGKKERKVERGSVRERAFQLGWENSRTTKIHIIWMPNSCWSPATLTSWVRACNFYTYIIDYFSSVRNHRPFLFSFLPLLIKFWRRCRCWRARRGYAGKWEMLIMLAQHQYLVCCARKQPAASSEALKSGIRVYHQRIY